MYVKWFIDLFVFVICVVLALFIPDNQEDLNVRIVNRKSKKR